MKRFLLRVVPDEPDRHRFLASLRAIGRTVGASVKHPRWTSYGAVEVDVFTPSHEDFHLFLAAAEPLSKVEFSRDLDEPPHFKPKEEVVREAVRYFDAERFWESHEALESVWRPAKGRERSLLQGIILVCAALVHEQRGEREVALGICRRALPQLEWDAPTYEGVDVRALRRNVEHSLAKGELRPFKL